ncbi:hypothetical protein [Bifidobacterium simiarum]|uniref:hypothetical protein n=1 Tax=Bifidobacterium simiarum TaxID=2045441 RepID=UPI001BDD39D3|nr:hypothetical protein [Bifidobacterium simiarum]MBT1166359.1 hypothetical protein [Bifidobacterium simiarum]
MKRQHTFGRWGKLGIAALASASMIIPVSFASAAEAAPAESAPAQTEQAQTQSAQTQSAQTQQDGQVAGGASAATNLSKTHAAAVAVNKTYTIKRNDGQYSPDYWYKFSVPKQGVVNVTYSPLSNSTDRFSSPELIDSANRVISKDPIADRSKTSLGQQGLAPGTYYLKFATFSRGSATTTFKVSYSVNANWETEWNNSRAAADVLTLGRTTNASSWANTGNGEQDWYRFTLTKATKVELAFHSQRYDSRDLSKWTARLYRSNLAQVGLCQWYLNQTGKSATLSLGAGTYYLQVASDIYGVIPPLNYNVTVSDLAVTKVPVYRVYNRRSGLHHYTTNASEKNMLVRLGWRDEGVSFNAARIGSPVYREYNRNNGNHNWTMNKAEHDMLVRLGWRGEGTAWTVNPNAGTKVYRLYNRHSGEHVYTTSYGEYVAVQRAGWKGEGVAWRSL